MTEPTKRRKIEKADRSELVPWDPTPGSIPLWLGIPICLVTFVIILMILLGWF